MRENYIPRKNPVQPRKGFASFPDLCYKLRTMTTEETTLVSKEEAAKILGCKVRTLELYVQQGRLGVRYVKGARGKKAQYDKAEVEALKATLESSTEGYMQRPSVAMQSPANPIASNQLIQALATVMRPAPVLLNGKMSMGIDEACEVSGYSKARIKRALRDKELPYTTDGPHGSIRIKCADLQRWVENL